MDRLSFIDASCLHESSPLDLRTLSFNVSSAEHLARGVCLFEFLTDWLHRAGNIRTRNLAHMRRTLYPLGHRLLIVPAGVLMRIFLYVFRLCRISNGGTFRRVGHVQDFG